MPFLHVHLNRLLMLVSFCFPNLAHTALVSGTISDWDHTLTPNLSIGDGSHHITLRWSFNDTDKAWFYGSVFNGDSDVAYATDVTDITQITDASAYDFRENYLDNPVCDADCDPQGTGDFIVLRNINSGHYGVLRLDDIVEITPRRELNATWWFQTDGSANFAVPLPSSIALLLTGLSAFLILARRTA